MFPALLATIGGLVASQTSLPGTVVAAASDGTLLLRADDSLIVLGVNGETTRVPFSPGPKVAGALAPEGKSVAVMRPGESLSLWERSGDTFIRRGASIDFGGARTSAAPLFMDGRLVVMTSDIVRAWPLDRLTQDAECSVEAGVPAIQEGFDLGAGLLAVHGDDFGTPGPRRTMPVLVDLRRCQKAGRLSHEERFPAFAGGTRVTLGLDKMRVTTRKEAFAFPSLSPLRARLAVSPDGNRVSLSAGYGTVTVFDLVKRRKTSFMARGSQQGGVPLTGLSDDGERIRAAMGNERVIWTSKGSDWEPIKIRKVGPDETAWLEALALIAEGHAAEALLRTKASPAPSSPKTKVGFVWVEAVAARRSNAELDALFARSGLKLTQRVDQTALVDVLEDFVAGELIGNAYDVLQLLNRVGVIPGLKQRVAELGLKLPSGSDAEAVKKRVGLLEWLNRLHSFPELKEALEVERMTLTEIEGG